MLKKIVGLLVVISMVGIGIAGGAKAEETESMAISVAVNGKTLELTPAPELVDDRVLVPLLPFVEQMGGMAIGRLVDQDVILARTHVISLRDGSSTWMVDGEDRKFDVENRQTSEFTMAAVRFIAESVGDKVEWNAAKNRVEITSDSSWDYIVKSKEEVGVFTPVDTRESWKRGAYSKDVQKIIEHFFANYDEYEAIKKAVLSIPSESAVVVIENGEILEFVARERDDPGDEYVTVPVDKSIKNTIDEFCTKFSSVVINRGISNGKFYITFASGNLAELPPSGILYTEYSLDNLGKINGQQKLNRNIGASLEILPNWYYFYYHAAGSGTY